MLAEVMRHQADMEEDRDDDGDLEESDASVARIDDSIKTQEKSRVSEIETPEPEVTGIRDTASEEYLWQMMIDKHGRQHFELIYEIIEKCRAERFFPEKQAEIKEAVSAKLQGQLSEPKIMELIQLVSTRMALEDHAKAF